MNTLKLCWNTDPLGTNLAAGALAIWACGFFPYAFIQELYLAAAIWSAAWLTAFIVIGLAVYAEVRYRSQIFGGLWWLAVIIAPPAVMYGIKGDYLFMVRWLLATSCLMTLYMVMVATRTPPRTSTMVRWCKYLGLYTAASGAATTVLSLVDIFRNP
jgi:hypothetical protein